MDTTLFSDGGAQARIAHHGAQVISWIPANQTEQLFLSKTSSFDAGKAIRGGVPIIFPQFSDRGPLPKHGFARNHLWQLRESNQRNRAIFELRDDVSTLAIWPFPFLVALSVILSDTALEMELMIQNTGTTEFQFTAALHNYFRVSRIGDVRISGFKNCRYQNSVTGERDCLDPAELLAIRSEVDRIYLRAPSQIQVQHEQHSIVLERKGFQDTVVWNPWQELGATLADLEPDGYQRLVCVESAAIVDPVKLSPGTSWRAGQSFHFYPT
jgi:glucose-6-phosphate 1-epimerase